MTITRVGTGLALLGALVAALSACGHTGPSAQSPERQAEAEYDLARDYFYKGEQRAALDHALKAVDLDDSNAKALYFTSELFLAFCAGNEGLTASDCKLAKAEQYARKAISQDDAFRDAKNLLGNVLILENKYKDAIEVLQPLVKDPSYTASYLAWGNLGWAQVQDGSIDQGIASLKNAVTPRSCIRQKRRSRASRAELHAGGSGREPRLPSAPRRVASARRSPAQAKQERRCLPRSHALPRNLRPDGFGQGVHTIDDESRLRTSCSARMSTRWRSPT